MSIASAGHATEGSERGRRLLLLVALMGLLPPAGATGPAEARPRPRAAVVQMKEELIAHLDARIRILEEARACVRAAASMKAVADCHARERRQTRELRENARAELRPPAARPETAMQSK